ncbi:MAG: protein kinase [Polyangiaceae bacterium]|nr:protein kinase [Polyangiaceae bacterium]
MAGLGPGTLLAGRYQLLSVIGQGGMGEVYQARRQHDGVIVAIKVLRKELLSDKDAVARFKREANAASALTSPYVARIFDVGASEEGQPFLVMELLSGSDLMNEIDTHGALPPGRAAGYVAQACLAMAEAHDRGIVHRDLKPSNLFLAGIGSQRVVKVLDFGISKVQALTDAKLTSTRMSFGTPLYMSPEQIRSTKLVDARTDIWSLGVILYETLTGQPPFIAETAGGLAVTISVEPHVPPSQVRPTIPAGLDDVVAKALAKDPAKRYQSVRELHDALVPFAPAFDPESTSRDPAAFNDTILDMPAATGPDDAAAARTSPATDKTGPSPPHLEEITQIPTPAGAWSRASPAPRRTPKGVAVAAGLLAGAGAVLLGVAVWAALRSPSHDGSNASAPHATMAASAEGTSAGPAVLPVIQPTTPAVVDPPLATAEPKPSGASSTARTPSSTGGKPRAGRTAKPTSTMLVPAAP